MKTVGWCLIGSVFIFPSVAWIIGIVFLLVDEL